MKTPIEFDPRSRKFFVWTSKWHVEYMKYFDAAEEAGNFVKMHHKRCTRVPLNFKFTEIDSWINEARQVAAYSINSESGTKDQEAKSSSSGPRISSVKYFLICLVIFVAAFSVNFIVKKDAAFVTLISTGIQAVGMILVVLVLLGIKKLIDRR